MHFHKTWKLSCIPAATTRLHIIGASKVSTIPPSNGLPRVPVTNRKFSAIISPHSRLLRTVNRTSASSVDPTFFSQNTTFGGTRGFTRKPSTPWVDDNGNVAGIVHQESGILYAIFDNVGSFTPYTNPTAVRTPPSQRDLQLVSLTPHIY